MNHNMLEIFLAVCETGTMTNASKKLYITQPAVSHAISVLEKEFETKLFERSSNGLYLTSAGKRLRNYAYQYLDFQKEIYAQVKKEGQKYTIRIGATTAAFSSVLSPLLSVYKKEHPLAEFYIVSDTAQSIQNMVLSAQLDVALTDGLWKNGELKQELLRTLPCHFICCALNEQYQDVMKLEEICQYPFLLPNKNDGVRVAFDRAMEGVGVTYRLAGEFNNLDMIRRGVAFDHGVSVLPEGLFPPFTNIKTVDVPDFHFENDIYLLTHENKHFNQELDCFIRFLKECAIRIPRSYGVVCGKKLEIKNFLEGSQLSDFY